MFHPVYRITNKVLRNVALIEAAREVISNAHLIPAWERQFQHEALVRQVYHATHIEGNPLNYQEAQKVLEGQSRQVIARDRDIQEIINYRNVIKYINEYRIPKVDESVFLHLHQLIVDKILPPDQSGRYRAVPVAIINSSTKEAVFHPPAANIAPQLVREFISWLESEEGKEVPATLRAGITHYELVRIHPFVDGNGRTARSMAMLILYQEGYDMRQFFCLDEHYDRDAERYYAALQSVNELGDLTLWLEYFIEGLAIEFNRIKERVLELSRDHNLKAKLGQISLNDRQVVLFKYVEDHGQITNNEWKSLIPNVSDDTILRDMKDLMKKKLIKKRGKTKAACYVLHQ